MKVIKDVVACILLLALTALAIQALLLVRAATASVAAVPAEIAQVREALDGRIAALEGDLMGQVSRVLDGDPRAMDAAGRAPLRGLVLAQVSGLRRDLLDPETGQLTLLRRESLERVDAALAEIRPVTEHAGNVLKQVDEAAPLFLDCDHNADCLFNRYVGTSKGIERAAENFGQASEDFRKALPPVLGNVELITAKFVQTEDQSQALMKETTGTMANFRKATTPLPGWARVFFQIAPPAAQAGAAVVGAGAALGWFRGK
jgi:hypothetical protein